jgi:DNA-binding response OmpR family regulator
LRNLPNFGENVSLQSFPVGEDRSADPRTGGKVRAGRILIVEDERHIARLLEFVLRKAGYDLCIANSAELALVQIEEFTPDALLLDLFLPGMSGLEFLRIFRERPSCASSVVIVLSSHSFEQTEAMLTAAGANAQCSKPIAPSTLLLKLQEFGVHPVLAEDG